MLSQRFLNKFVNEDLSEVTFFEDIGHELCLSGAASDQEIQEIHEPFQGERLKLAQGLAAASEVGHEFHPDLLRLNVGCP